MKVVVKILRNTTLFVIISVNYLYANDLSWLPKGSFFPTPYLDPAACQQGISIFSYEVAGETQQLMYVPISLSMRQQFLRATNLKNNAWELGMEFCIFSQFSIVDAGEAFMGGLQNADYRISSVFHYQQNESWFYRVSLFHQSSHLGDDYIIRNSISHPTLRTQNYEQLDLALVKRLAAWNIYGLLGYNISPNTIRKRLMFQLGGEWTHPLPNRSGLTLVGGLDMKVYEHYDFTPNMRIAAGIKWFQKDQTPVKILFNYYTGHLPYSTLDYQKVRLVGLSLVLDIDRSFDMK